MKWKKLFYPDPANATLEKAKSVSLILLIVTLLLFLGFIGVCAYESIKQIPLELKVTAISEKIISPKINNGFSYQNNSEGMLSISNISFPERLLLYKTDNKNIIDYGLFFLIGLTLFLSMRSVNNKKIFSEKISNYFTLIGFLFTCMFLVGGLFESLLINNLVLHITNHQYHIVLREGKMDYMIFGAIILLFVYFSNQGTYLQKEQDLTI